MIWLAALVVLVTALALVLHQLPVWRLSGLVRFLYYIPGALAGAASVLVWLFMLDPTVSPAASFLHLLGYSTFSQVIAPSHLAILFAMIAFWTGAGGWIVVMYGALNNIPLDVMEAARIDGAGAWRIARYIQIPMLRKWIVYMAILAFATGAQLFVEPQLVSEASLGVAGRDYSPNQLAYDFAFQNNNVNSRRRSPWSSSWSAWRGRRIRGKVEILRCELTHPRSPCAARPPAASCGPAGASSSRAAGQLLRRAAAARFRRLLRPAGHLAAAGRYQERSAARRTTTRSRSGHGISCG